MILRLPSFISLAMSNSASSCNADSSATLLRKGPYCKTCRLLIRCVFSRRPNSINHLSSRAALANSTGKANSPKKRSASDKCHAAIRLAPSKQSLSTQPLKPCVTTMKQRRQPSRVISGFAGYMRTSYSSPPNRSLTSKSSWKATHPAFAAGVNNSMIGDSVPSSFSVAGVLRIFIIWR